MLFPPSLTLQLMVSNVLAAAAILRQHYRRFRSIGLIGSLTALGLVPLALYMPRTAWARYILLSLVCIYAGRKAIQFIRARAALKQLSMEEHFLRYGSSDGQVQKCVDNDENLWTRSCTLAALRAVAPRRLPEELLYEQKRERLYAVYRRAFRQIIPPSAYVDLSLLGGMCLLIITAPMIQVDLRAVMFQAGILALGMAAAAEASHLFVIRRLSDALRRLFHSLSDWTLKRGLVGIAYRSPTYSHRLLYFAHPWFASSGDGEEINALVLPSAQNTPVFSEDAAEREALVFSTQIAESVERAFSGDGGVSRAEIGEPINAKDPKM